MNTGNTVTALTTINATVGTTSARDYANEGACRRAARNALKNPKAVRGVDFQMVAEENGRFTWFEIVPGIDSALTREQWLREMTTRLHSELFVPVASVGELPKFRVSCGFPGGGSRGKRIGECWSAAASTDGHTEMFISPILDDSNRVAGVLVHEMVHMMVGNEAGHGPVFKALATKVGLTGKMTATTETPELVEFLNTLIADMGEYPHSKLKGQGPTKKKVTYLKKVTCNDSECEATFRITQKFIDKANGALTCPCCGGETTIEEK